MLLQFARLSSTRAKKQVLILTNNAVQRLRELQKSGEYLRVFLFDKIGTKKKGCSGLSYTMDYVKDKNRFDELVKQDGVEVLVDSKALFTLIGSTMDFETDKLSSRFTFQNPNVKEMCGCGESFMV
jgi:iron-sulfur cluster assembly protein